MSELPRPARARDQLTITKGHLFALGLVSFFLATMAFFVGLKLGRGGATVEEAPKLAALLDDEAKTGNLEALLMRVEAAQQPARLVFPVTLPQSPPPLAVTDDVDAPAPPADPVVVPEPAADGTANVPPAGGAPEASDAVPTRGWTIEVGTRATVAEAETLVGSLRAAGLKAYHVEAMVDGRPEHRVRVGGYGSEQAATEALAEVRGRAGASTATVLPVR